MPTAVNRNKIKRPRATKTASFLALDFSFVKAGSVPRQWRDHEQFNVFKGADARSLVQRLAFHAFFGHPPASRDRIDRRVVSNKSPLSVKIKYLKSSTVASILTLPQDDLTKIRSCVEDRFKATKAKAFRA
jgi:hypothetical protein